MKVWVVMANDFPDSVFASEEAAKEYCQIKKEEPDNKLKYSSAAYRVYYRHYDFEVIGELK